MSRLVFLAVVLCSLAGIEGFKKKAKWTTCVPIHITKYETHTIRFVESAYFTRTVEHTISSTIPVTLTSVVESSNILWNDLTTYQEPRVVTRTATVAVTTVVTTLAEALLHTAVVYVSPTTTVTQFSVIPVISTATSYHPYSTVTDTGVYWYFSTHYDTSLIIRTRTKVLTQPSVLPSVLEPLEPVTVISSVYEEVTSCYPAQTKYVH